MASRGAHTVGIVGRKTDPHVKALATAVEARGDRAAVVDFHNFPRFNLATMTGEPETPWTFDDLHQRSTLDLRELDVVCLRTLCFTDLDDGAAAGIGATAAEAHYAAELARLGFQTALLERLARRIPVVNPPRSFRHHRLKAGQHARLLGAGIPTPAARTTSDEAAARAFAARFERVVVKPLGSGAEVVLADDAFFDAHRQRFGRRPFLFQQFVRGRSLRAYVLGGRVVSLGELHYDPRHVDWRERTEGVTVIEPEPWLAAACARAVRLLELPYCGIDIEWDGSTNQYYFLDFNPSALFVGWSRLARIDLAREIARYLGQVLEAGGDPWLGRGELEEQGT